MSDRSAPRRAWHHRLPNFGGQAVKTIRFIWKDGSRAILICSAVLFIFPVVHAVRGDWQMIWPSVLLAMMAFMVARMSASVTYWRRKYYQARAGAVWPAVINQSIADLLTDVHRRGRKEDKP